MAQVVPGEKRYSLMEQETECYHLKDDIFINKIVYNIQYYYIVRNFSNYVETKVNNNLPRCELGSLWQIDCLPAKENEDYIRE